MADLKRKHYLALICFFSLLFVFGLFLLYNNLAAGQNSRNGIRTPEPQPKPSGTPAPTLPEEEAGLGVYVRNALENGLQGCGDSVECQRLFLLSEKECSGPINERIFCLAAVDFNADYCEWIDINWHSITCKAFFERSFEKCLEIMPQGERLLCIKDLALNIPEIDCNALAPALAKECFGFRLNWNENK